MATMKIKMAMIRRNKGNPILLIGVGSYGYGGEARER